MVGSETSQNQTRPAEVCESCRQRPATETLLRSGTIEINAKGQVVAEIDPRVAVCRQCWLEITSDRRDMPPSRVIARPNPDTGMMEPV